MVITMTSGVRVPRTYEPIWQRIKKRGRAIIACAPEDYRKIKKAVIKEKHKDLGFKLLNDHDYFFLKITYDNEKRQATFILRESVGVEGVRCDE
jgi:hypothetical protein